MNNSEKCLLSLDGLSTGDAIGEHFIRAYPEFSWVSPIPAGPLPWTDDTAMALSIVEVLLEKGGIDQDLLAEKFAERFLADDGRGYSRKTGSFLTKLHAGGDWRILGKGRFGDGSFGNGGAMRAAPVGGFFAGDHDRIIEQAALSAEVTHLHPEGIAGAVAVAVAAGLAAEDPGLRGVDFLDAVLDQLPDGELAALIGASRGIPAGDLIGAIKKLGTGYRVTAQDTVPFCLWVAAHHGADYETALRVTMQGMGDTDTTCAIVGGIVSLRAGGVPGEMLAAREALPALE